MKNLISVSALALLAGVTFANAQAPAPSPSPGATTKENVPGAGSIGSGGAAATTSGATKAAQPPEGEEGTRRPGQQAPAGNAPVAK